MKSATGTGVRYSPCALRYWLDLEGCTKPQRGQRTRKGAPAPSASALGEPAGGLNVCAADIDCHGTCDDVGGNDSHRQGREKGVMNQTLALWPFPAPFCRMLSPAGDRPPPQPADLGWWTDAANAWIRGDLDAEPATASQAELCLALCTAWLTLGCRHRIGRAASSALVAKVGVVANFGACQYSLIVAPEDRASTRG